MEFIRAVMIMFASFFILFIIGQAIGWFWFCVCLVLGFVLAYEERTK